MATNPFEFLQQVRSEASKVVWPTRRETLITTGLVMLMVVFTSVFFLVVDELSLCFTARLFPILFPVHGLGADNSGAAAEGRFVLEPERSSQSRGKFRAPHTS